MEDIAKEFLQIIKEAGKAGVQTAYIRAWNTAIEAGVGREEAQKAGNIAARAEQKALNKELVGLCEDIKKGKITFLQEELALDR